MYSSGVLFNRQRARLAKSSQDLRGWWLRSGSRPYSSDCRAWAQRIAARQLKLLNLTQRLKELLAITKLLTVFDTYDDEASAIESFS